MSDDAATRPIRPTRQRSKRVVRRADRPAITPVQLGVSVHTAHAYVKEIYRRAGVTSRAELMTRFLPTLSKAGPRTPANRST